MKKLLIASASIVLGLAGAACGVEIHRAVLLTPSPVQYGKTEWTIFLTAQWENPYDFTDITLDMNCVSPSGTQQTLPCFYVSGRSVGVSVWKARFALLEPGEYHYRFVLRSKGGECVSKPAVFSVKASGSRGFLRRADLWTFRFDSGEPFRGIGENIGWESRDEDDSRHFKSLHEDPRFNYDDMLAKLAASGGNFFRTWMIYWNLPVDWKTVANNRRYRDTASFFNESAMERMDHLVSLCDSLGLYMMLALDSHAGLMATGWDISPYNIKNGGTAESPADFFTNEGARHRYKCKLRLLAARWGYSPSIAMWEFFNEIDNVMFQGGLRIPDSVIVRWHDEMSRFLSDVDPYDHIITTSISHRDVGGLNTLEAMDVNQRHIYRNTRDIPRVIGEYSEKFHKPYIIGEFSYEWDWSKNFIEFADEMDSDFRRGLWYGLFSPTPVLPMSWWWEFFENRGTMNYFSRVREIHENMLQSGRGVYESFDVKAGNGLIVQGVRCGSKGYIYALNPLKMEKEIVLSLSSGSDPRPELQVFDCETGIYHAVENVEWEGGTLRIRDFRMQPGSDTILILNDL